MGWSQYMIEGVYSSCSKLLREYRTDWQVRGWVWSCAFHCRETMAQIAEAYAMVSEEQILATVYSVDLFKTYLKEFWNRKEENSAYLIERFIELKAWA